MARAVLVTGLLVVGATACTGPDAAPTSSEGGAELQPSSAPLAAYDDGTALLPRTPCTDVPADALTDALGADVESTLTWVPGERLPDSPEIADEYGCRHAGGDATASAWVFAAPTSPGRARRLADELPGPACRRVTGAETFGDPGIAFTCEPENGAPLTGLRGLVGTSWVACEIRGTDDAERVDRWCAAVLASLSAP